MITHVTKPDCRNEVSRAIDAKRGEILLKAASKPLRSFYQIDGFADGEILKGWDDDLRNMDLPVRVTIHDGSKKADVLELLREIVGIVESMEDDFNKPTRPVAYCGCTIPF